MHKIGHSLNGIQAFLGLRLETQLRSNEECRNAFGFNSST